MPSIDDIAAGYVERAAALDPCYATYAGIAGHDHELADLGADGFAGRAGLDRSTLAALDAAEAPDGREQVARAAMRERLALAVECYDAGDTTSKLNTINSSRAAGLAMAFKLIESAQDRWRAVNAPHLVALVGTGAVFVNGKLVERPGEDTPPEAAGSSPPPGDDPGTPGAVYTVSGTKRPCWRTRAEDVLVHDDQRRWLSRRPGPGPGLA